MRRISEIIERIIETNPRLSKLKLFSVKTAWRKAVGEILEKKAKVVGFENGILFVECRDPLWLSEIHFRKKRIVEKMNAILGEGVVKDIRITR